jgi:hypothetical protein
MEQLEMEPLPSFNHITRSFYKYFLNKNIAYHLLHVVLSGHSIYVVFVDLTEAYIMNALYNILLWSLQVLLGCSILTLHVLPSQNGILRGECHTLRSRCAFVWKYLVANLEHVFSLLRQMRNFLR